MLLPLWRTEPLYHELRASHSRYERVHRHWRERYLVGGDTLANRPKRRGSAWQDLRAQGALLVEWLCVATREGWLGSARRNQKSASSFASLGERKAEGLRRFRKKIGLHRPYGPRAAALGAGNADPPSARGKAPPGADPPGDPPDDSVPF